MEDPDEAVCVLQELSDMGFILSIDDYGTGYSSMEYLKRLPVNELKIDKSFVLEVNKSKTDQVIVNSAIELGHNLGLKVIAEGIEEESAIDILKQSGCDVAQGYFFSRPLAVADFEQWLIDSPWDC